MITSKKIRYYRKQARLSQGELGNRLDPPVSKNAVCKWEQGTVNNIRREYLIQMAEIFDTTPSDLSGYTEDCAGPLQDMPERYYMLNEEGRLLVSDYLNMLLANQKYTRNF